MIQKIPAQLKQAMSLLHSGLVSLGLVALGFAAFLAVILPLGTHVRDYWKDVLQGWSYPAASNGTQNLANQGLASQAAKKAKP